MTTWQEIIHHYHIKYHNQIAKTADPLNNYFHITCVDYIKIDNAGKFSYLCTHPECAQYYASEQLFYSDPYFRHPSTHRTGIFTMESIGSSEFKKNNRKVSDQFNLHFPLILSEKTSDSVELFCFSGENPDALLTLYLHYSPLLKLFATHFKKKLSKLLHEMEEASFSLIDLQGDHFYEGIEQTPTINTESLHAYLIALGKKREIEQASSLSPRERDCLKLLIHGHSAKDSATELHLSPRTVESYLENIKNKLSCSNKRELFSIATNLSSLGLL